MISRRFFLLGTAASATAAITPLGILNTEAMATIVDPHAKEFLRRVILKWDSIAEHYDLHTMYRVHIPQISGRQNMSFGQLEDTQGSGMIQYVSAIIEDEMFSYDEAAREMTARYKINSKWYTLTLKNENTEFTPAPTIDIYPNTTAVDKTKEYLDLLGDRQEVINNAWGTGEYEYEDPNAPWNSRSKELMEHLRCRHYHHLPEKAKLNTAEAWEKALGEETKKLFSRKIT